VRTGDLAERLQQDIHRLAADHEAPSFEPHVTLLGGTEKSEEDALRITADLAQSLQVGDVHHYELQLCRTVRDGSALISSCMLPFMHRHTG
jgi:2'-5' RNA ligase